MDLTLTLTPSKASAGGAYDLPHHFGYSVLGVQYSSVPTEVEHPTERRLLTHGGGLVHCSRARGSEVGSGKHNEIQGGCGSYLVRGPDVVNTMNVREGARQA